MAEDRPESQSPQLIATAYHEAGHAVAAYVVGRPIEKATIVPAEMNTGGSRLGAVKMLKGRSKKSKDQPEDEVLVLLAGMVGESQFTGRYCQQAASRDLQFVRRILRTRTSNDRQLQKLAQRMLDRTEHLLDQPAHRQAIKRIAEELLKNETVSGRAVRHFVEEAKSANQ